MILWQMYALAGVAIATIGMNGVFSREHPVKKIIAANLVGSGVFLFLVALARRDPSTVPDPVPHALVLTGIVVSVSTTAAALAFARRLFDAGPAGSAPVATEGRAELASAP